MQELQMKSIKLQIKYKKILNKIYCILWMKIKVVQQQETPEWAKKLSSSIKELAAQVEELRVEGIKVHQDRISMEYNDQQDQQENGENDHEAYDYDYQEDNQSTKSEEDEDENEDEDNSPKSKQNQQSAKSASGSENGHKKKSPTQKPAAATTKTSKSK